MGERFGKNQKPLFVINRPVKVKVYRSNFKPFATLRFLDAKKLEKARGQWLELGTIEAVGRSATLVGKIQKGELTRLSLRGCVGCQPKGKTRKRGIDKNVLLAIRDKLEDVRAGTIKLPQRLPSSRRRAGRINIRIWPPPIVIVIGDELTVCIIVFIGRSFCYLCTDGDVVAKDCIILA